MGAFDDLIPGAKPSQAGAFDDLIPAPAPAQGGRSAGQIAKDTAFAVTSGAASVAKPFAMALDRVRTGQWVGPATEAVSEFQQSQQEGKSEELQQAAREASERTAQRGRMVTDALGDKNLAAKLWREAVEFGSGAYEAVKNPDLLFDQAAQMTPMMKGSQVVGRATERAGGAVAKVLPARAADVVARGSGTAGAVAAGSSMQAADVGSEAFQRLMQLPDETWQQNAEFRQLAAQIGPDQAKRRIAADKAAQAAGQGGAISLAASLLPGGAAMERALVSRRLPVSAAAIGRATGGEFVSEALEEGGGRLAQNVAVAGVDPQQDVLQGVGEAGGQGGAMGGLMGGGATAVRQGLSAYADRQGKVPKAPPAAAPVPTPAPSEPSAPAAPEQAAQPAAPVSAPAPAQAPEVMADPLMGQATDFIRSLGKASLPQLQRHLRVGYNRADRLMAQLEAAGVVSAKNEQGGRTVLPFEQAAPASAVMASPQGEQAAQQVEPDSDVMGAPAQDLGEGASPEGAGGPQPMPAPAAPSSNAAGQDINLQNRDRSTAASVAQMMTIARNPDYGRLGLSRTPDSGAPMVFAVGNDTMRIAPDAFGGADVATMSDGQRVPFRYAVVPADQVEPSHFADGRVNPAFSQEVHGALKALNNGRTAGLRASYEMGSAGSYRAELERDAANLGIAPEVIARTRNPVLVRVYDEAANTAGMAAKSQAQSEALSVPEQAASDAPLIDAGLLQAYQGGGLDLAKNTDFVRGFVQRLQATGQPIGKMMQADGRLSAEGLTRLNAAMMQVAYSDTSLVEKFFASTDGDMKGIGAALKDVAADWAVMRTRAASGELPADVDVTGNLLQALRLIEQARSQGQSIFDMAYQVDLETGEAPDALTVNLLGLFFTGQHFTRPASQSTLQGRLQRYIQAASATSADADMFGEVVTRDDILTTILGKESLNDVASQPEPQTAAPQGQREPERLGAAGDAAAAGGDRGRGQQREGAGQDPAARGAEQSGEQVGEVPASGEAGGQGFGEGAGDQVAATVNEPEASYQPDLFSDPLELLGQSVPSIPGKPGLGRSPAAAEPGNLDAAGQLPGDTPTPPGEFFVNTLVGVERQRSLGADHIGSLSDLAQATQYLYRSAIERFDGIVTDAAGKPLAVVGGFKGGLAQAQIYVDTLVGEAVRVPGAARIWFSHNHPSGMPDLSEADLMLNQRLETIFRGSGIEPQGLIAVGRGRFQGVTAAGDRDRGPVLPPDGRTEVPAIERQLSDLRSTDAPAVESPADAMRMAREFHARNGNGLMLFDSHLRLAGWIPIPAQPEQLRGGPGLNAIYRAISQSNAASGIVVHDGALDERLHNAATVAENLGGALRLGGARPLDIINVKTGQSAATRGLDVESNTVLSRATAATVETPEFKRWFGDSKIVDADGAPRVMFHGTARDITAFRPKQANAIFVTDDPEFAADFAANSEYWMLDRGMKDGAQNIMPVFVKANDPFDFADRAHVADVADWMMKEFGEETRDGPRQLPPREGLSREPLTLVDLREVLRGDQPDNWRAIEHPWTQRAIRALGFDAFYVREEGRKNLAVYEPTQLKSATGNQGTFDAENPDLRFSRGDGARGVPLEQLQQLADRVKERLPNAPPIEVLDSPRDAPMALRLHILAAQAFNDAEGAVHDGRIYLFARNLASMERAEHVLAEHEVAHAGLRAVLGNRRTQAMQMLANLNPALRQEAARKAKTLGLSLTAALEEVLVDMPTDELPRLQGWQRFLEMLADGLERMGLASAAAALRAGSDQQALQLAGDLIRAARDHAAGLADATQRGVRAVDRLAALQQAESSPTIADPARAAPALSSRQAGPAEPMRQASTFDEARAAAKDFMGQDLVNAETGMVARVSRNTLDKMLSSKAVGKSETPATHSLAVANADALFERALFGWVKPDAKGDPNITVHRFFAPLATPAGTAIVKLTVKETRRADQPNPLYTVEAVELNEETPAAQWVDSTVRADGLDPTSIRSVGAIRSLAEWVQANNADGEPMLSRAPGDGASTTAAERADQIINRAAARRAPVDKAMQLLAKFSGLEFVAGRVYDTGALLLRRMTPEFVKAGVVSDYGLADEVKDRRSMLAGRQRNQIRDVAKLVQALGALTRDESRVAYEWLNGDDQATADEMLAKLPAASVQVLEQVRELIDELSQEAVRLGQLSPEAFERNRWAYLHRSYAKHELGQTAEEKRQRSAGVKILGDQYKGRGITKSATMAQLQNGAPEWWGRRLEAGKADTGLKGQQFVRLEKRVHQQANGRKTKPGMVDDGTAQLEGFEAPSVKTRIAETVYIPVGQPVPPKFDGWTNAGVFEVRDVRGPSVELWRDFTKAERQAMGELDEVRYAITKTMHGMIHDIEVGKYLEWLGQNYAIKAADDVPGDLVPDNEATFAGRAKPLLPGQWARVPETKIPGTDTLKYGLLAGRYVEGPVWNEVRQAVEGDYRLGGPLWNKLLGWWKLTKTALSPGVHTNNVMANMVMADWHGVQPAHVAKALRVVLAASEQDGKGVLGKAGRAAEKLGGIKDTDAAREILNRYRDSGGDVGMWATNELARDQMKPLLDELEAELQQGASEGEAQIGVASAVQMALQRRFPEAFQALKGSRPTKAAANEAQKLIDLYQAEDDVFRLAAWLRAKEEGRSDMEAGDAARTSFLDYQINAPWIQALRSTALPFISFTYRGLPMLLETAGKKPHKLMKLMLLAGLANALGGAIAGGDDDDEVRALLPDEKAGRIWGMVPKLIRMPWNDQHGNPVFLDIRRWVPMGDIADVGQGHAAFGVPPSLMPGGPLAVLGELWANKSAFTGQPITLETDSAGEKTSKVLGHLYRSAAPNLLGLPGTYATQGVVDAAKGKTDVFGREQSVGQALASAVGVKASGYAPDELRRNAAFETKAKLDEIRKQLSQAARQEQRKGISQEELDDVRERQKKKISDVLEDYRRKTEPEPR